MIRIRGINLSRLSIESPPDRMSDRNRAWLTLVFSSKKFFLFRPGNVLECSGNLYRRNPAQEIVSASQFNPPNDSSLCALSLFPKLHFNLLSLVIDPFLDSNFHSYYQRLSQRQRLSVLSNLYAIVIDPVDAARAYHPTSYSPCYSVEKR